MGKVICPFKIRNKFCSHNSMFNDKKKHSLCGYKNPKKCPIYLESKSLLIKKVVTKK